MTKYSNDADLVKLNQKLLQIKKAFVSIRKRIIVISLATTTIGFLIAFTSPIEYSTSMRLLPYSGSSQRGLVPGLAGLAGIGLRAAQSEQVITSEVYPEIFNSFDFRSRLANKPIRFSVASDKITVIEYFELIANAEWGTREGGTKSKISPEQSAATAEETPTAEGSTDVQSFSAEYIERIQDIGDRLSLSVDKRTSVITISSKLPDAIGSAEFANAASQMLMEALIEYESRKATEQLAFVKSQLNVARDKYEKSEVALASYLDRNRSRNQLALDIELDKVKKDYDLANDIYATLRREYEQLQLKRNQDTPLFTVIQRATVPNEKSEPERAKIVLSSFILSLILSIGYLAIYTTASKMETITENSSRESR